VANAVTFQPGELYEVSSLSSVRPLRLQLFVRTQVSTAMLFSALGANTSLNYLTVGLIAGSLFVSFDYGGAVLYVSANVTIADGAWHSIMLTRTSTSAIIGVDDLVAATSSVAIDNDGWRSAFDVGTSGRVSAIVTYFNASVTQAWCAHRCLDDELCTAFSYRPAIAAASGDILAPVTVLPPACVLGSAAATAPDYGFTSFVLLNAPSVTLGGRAFDGCVANLLSRGTSLPLPLGRVCNL
jgi:hypothetical protein